jgi:signal transduction histidine kinase
VARIRLGLRPRIALALAAACLLVVGALGVTLYTASEELEDGLISQIIEEEMSYLAARHGKDPSYQPEGSSNLQSYVVRDGAGRERLPEFLRDVEPGRHEFLIGANEFHVLVQDGPAARYYVAYEVGLHAQREHQFKLLLLFSIVTAALLSLALGYWLSGLLVRQVTELASKVARLRPGQQHGRLAREGQDTEIALLARAFEDYENRIEQMIRREQEFTSNASHELRTPLTAIRTSCELLLSDASITGKSRDRIEWINNAASRMTEQVQALLFLARGQALGDLEPVALADCVADAVEPYRAEITRKGLALELSVAPETSLELNYQALRLVLANLLRNAVTYTERGFVRIAYTAKRLTVADSGRGIDSEQLPRVFERFFRSEQTAGGAGLGLAIVKRICDQYGWKIEVESAPSRGSTFSIVFP